MTSLRSVYTAAGPYTGPGPQDATASLFRSALFRGLDRDDATALGHDFRFLDVECGRVLFCTGDTGDHLYVVLSGSVKLIACQGAREQLIALVGPGDQFGQLSIFDSERHSVTAVAGAHTRLARITRDDLQAQAVARPQVAMHLLRAAAHRLRWRNSVVSDFVFIDSGGRIAKLLLTLAQQFGATENGELTVEHGLTQTELAQLVGATRETMNKTLSNFANRGWIRIDCRGVVVIRDQDSLVRRSNR